MTLENKHSKLRNITKTSPKLACLLLILQVTSVPTANALEVLTYQELTSHCALFSAVKDEPAMEIIYKSLLNNYPRKQ